jgi:hypothetical protein
MSKWCKYMNIGKYICLILSSHRPIGPRPISTYRPTLYSTSGYLAICRDSSLLYGLWMLYILNCRAIYICQLVPLCTMENLVEWRLARETEVLGKNLPQRLCPPQITLDQTRDRTRAAAVGSQRLTAWAMARPNPPLYLYPVLLCLVSTLCVLHSPSSILMLQKIYTHPRTTHSHSTLALCHCCKQGQYTYILHTSSK